MSTTTTSTTQPAKQQHPQQQSSHHQQQQQHTKQQRFIPYNQHNLYNRSHQQHQYQRNNQQSQQNRQYNNRNSNYNNNNNHNNQYHYNNNNHHNYTNTGFEDLTDNRQPNDPFLAHVVRCSLIDILDHTLLLQLRDGNIYIGIMISFDQFSNIVLNNVIQRKIIGDIYYDVNIGTMIIKGDNIVLITNYNNNNWLQNTKLHSVDQVEYSRVEKEYKEKQKRILEAKQLINPDLKTDEDLV